MESKIKPAIYHSPKSGMPFVVVTVPRDGITATAVVSKHEARVIRLKKIRSTWRSRTRPAIRFSSRSQASELLAHEQDNPSHDANQRTLGPGQLRPASAQERAPQSTTLLASACGCPARGAPRRRSGKNASADITVPPQQPPSCGESQDYVKQSLVAGAAKVLRLCFRP